MKLVANAGELVPSAILDGPLAEAVRMPGVHRFMIECGKEAARAALADGSRLVPIFGLTESQVTGPSNMRKTCSAKCSPSTRCQTPAPPCCRTG